MIFAVLERWLLQLRETDSSFVVIIDEIGQFTSFVGDKIAFCLYIR